MSEFLVYLGLGKDHILDYANGYDHILFVLALCAVYKMGDWKRVLILVTAFTVGHSITLALATLSIVNVRTDIIEFLIPVTIFITALSNILRRTERFQSPRLKSNYSYALIFGLIHGLGFSNYLKAILGQDERVVTQLLAFNLGLEFGQIIIVVLFMIVSFILVDVLNRDHRDFKLVTSSAIAGVALVLIKETVFW